MSSSMLLLDTDYAEATLGVPEIESEACLAGSDVSVVCTVNVVAASVPSLFPEVLMVVPRKWSGALTAPISEHMFRIEC